MPGDAFFTSLALERGHQAIAIVLSGSDGDGSLGLKAIKAAGGVTFSQREETAKFSSMPHNAIATGDVDFVLSPTQIAEELASLSQNPLLSCRLPHLSLEPLPVPKDALTTIFALLRGARGVDFSRYKPKTLERRMRRRMVLCKLTQLEDYAAYLQAHPDEVKALHEEILIHVTSFFRNPEAFDLLKTRVFPIVTQKESAESPIRIWVAGCSTGEEVYSIAICLLEFLSDKISQPPIQIFATDISDLAISKARVGIYSENQMVDVSAERCRRFFHPVEGNGYQITKAVRELCVFARQNVASDPPFSNLDLISCRNVLIYLDNSLQKRIMPIFHNSLNPTGFLLLGTSETTGQGSDLFTLVESKYRIYTKNFITTRSTFSFAPSSYPAIKARDRQSVSIASEAFALQRKVDQLISNHYAPAGVVIDDQMQVLQPQGDINRYLQIVSGVANFTLFSLVRPGLLIELQSAIYQAQQQETSVTRTGLRMEEGDHIRIVTIHVFPFKVLATGDRRFLVLFEEAPVIVSSPSPIDLENPQGDLEQEIGWLRQENARLKQENSIAVQERAATQEYLQTVIQEQEHSNQDLKIANEEILSSNEELQSTNEELETAKEEIQATNEELTITNEELGSRQSELQQINNDLTNFLASTNIPILMLTYDLRIRRFTPMAQQLFNFIATDTGRQLSDIRTQLNIPDLESLILEVLETLSVKELDVQTQSGHWYTLRIRPYRTAKNQIDGVVLVLLDIDALKRSAVTLEEARNYAEAIVETVQVPLIVLDSDLRVNKANRSFYQMFQLEPNEPEQALIFDLGNGQWNIPELRSRLEDVFANNTILQDFEVEHQFEQIGQKTMLLNACKLILEGESQRILLSIEDITERKQFETERSQLLSQEQSARQEAETANRAKDEFLSNLSHELRNPLNSMLGWARMLRTRRLDEASVARALEVIERSATAQSQLIDDILDVSRIISGKLSLSPRLIDLVLVVNKAIETVQISAEAKSIQIVSRLTSATIVGDIDRLQQVLWNLLSNAIKFTPLGGRVEITVEPMQTQAEIRVWDTGLGIRAEVLPYVFERFRQGDSSTTKPSPGLGLGLSIVRHIVELHGGTVQAESPGIGQGTTITVRFPLRSASLEATSLSQPKPSTAELDVVSQTIPLLAGVPILAVDDNKDNLHLLKYILEEAGAKVSVATSAKETLAAMRASPGRYDVLLADIGMPDEDGLVLIRQVRALDAEAGGQILAIALTAHVSAQEQQMAIEAGFQMHLAKPVDPVHLVLSVASLVERKDSESVSG